MGLVKDFVMDCKRGHFDLGELVLTIRSNEPKLEIDTPVQVFRELVRLHGGSKYWHDYLGNYLFVVQNCKGINEMVMQLRAADGCC